MMKIHEFGKENRKNVLLIHPSMVMWDYFEYVISLLETDHHLFIPALPGYDPDEKSDFSSVEKIASDLVDQLFEMGIDELDCIYGCSMGGSIVIRILADHKIKVRNALIDGGITPYQLPWILTRLIAVRDFLLIYMGKLGGIRLLEKAFNTAEYSDEDLKYIADVLKMVSTKTIWNTFDSCNNYSMPEPLEVNCERIIYSYAKEEERARKWDISYMKKKFPDTVFEKYEGVGHGGLAVLKPEILSDKIRTLCENDPL